MIYLESAAGLGRRQILKVLAYAGVAEFSVLAAGKNLEGLEINHSLTDPRITERRAVSTAMFFGFQVSDQDGNQLYLWAGDALIRANGSVANRNAAIEAGS